MEEFVTRTIGKKNCDGPVTGVPHPSFDYIARSTTGDDQYPTEAPNIACQRYLQVNGKFDALQVTGNVATDTLSATGNVTAPTFIGNLTGVASGNKVLAAFDIPHVTQEGKRIRHIVAEGPEAGIYVRGKLKGSNTIDLPEYWNGLVDPETITVTLTQIGHSQDLIVQSVENNVVTIISGNGSDIHCYYEIWVARWINPMDHNEKLTVVYDGKTPDDYPDGNKNFLIGGWDYDRRNPQWENPLTPDA